MDGRIGGLVGGYIDRCMGEYVNRLWGRQKDGRCISILICTSVFTVHIIMYLHQKRAWLSHTSIRR